MKKIVRCCLLIISAKQLIAQDYFPTNEVVKSSNEQFAAFTNATIHVNATTTIEKGTLLIQN